MEFSTISQDDEHLSWGRIKKEKEGRVGEMHMTEHGERGARADVLSTQSTREPDVVNGIRESMRSGSRLCFRCVLYCKALDVDG
jgi:hypothetical protein